MMTKQTPSFCLFAVFFSRTIMSLQCLAIIGKANEPLYLMDIKDEEATASEETETEEDIFGFSEQSQTTSLRKEFMMHASLDSLEDAIGEQHSGTNKSTGKWIGLLTAMEDSYIYGYMTSTNIKILAMVSDYSNDSNKQVHLKTLFAKVHNMFVEYMLNPWSTLQSKIESSSFENGILDAVKVYDDENGIAWA